MKYAKRFANRRTRFLLWLALRLLRSDEHRARLAMALLDEMPLASVRNTAAYAAVVEMQTLAAAPGFVEMDELSTTPAHWVDDNHKP